MNRPAQIAVVGGGIGGLVAAGLLARAGSKVTLYEQEGRLGGKAQQLTVGSTVLDTGPTLLTMPALVRETFGALGAEDLLPRLMALSPQCEYRWEDGSGFVVHPELERTRASVEAMAPGEGRGVGSFYAAAAAIHRAAGEPYLEAPFEGVASFLGRVVRRGPSAVLQGMQMSTLQALASHHFRDGRMQQFVGRFATYTGASPYQASAAFALIPHLERVEGVHHVEGGMGALVAALERAVRRLGVDIRLGTRGGWRPAGRGWRVGPAGDEAPVDAVVVNADPIGASGVTGGPLAMSGYVLLLEAGVRSSLRHHTVFFSRDSRREFEALFSGRVPADPTVYVCHPSASDPGMAAPGCSGLFVMANVPAMGEAFLPHADALRARCIAVVEALDPSLRGQLRILGERTPVDFQRQGAPRGSLYGFLPHGRFGPFRRPRSHAAPGLVYAGGGTHPGGGVPMVMLSGRFAAMQVSADLEARG
ncbi:MAG TPA: phytoene desaturase family protein [Myxococcaceae bacterium]|nr:phytoene desaturase family protein [Myxococcaceae bacterium]